MNLLKHNKCDFVMTKTVLKMKNFEGSILKMLFGPKTGLDLPFQSCHRSE